MRCEAGGSAPRIPAEQAAVVPGARDAQAIRLGYRFRSSIYEDGAACHGGAVDYSLDLPSLSPGARLGACRATWTNRTLSTSSDELSLTLRGVRAFDLRPFTLELGLVAGGALLHQRIDTRGEAPSRLSMAGVAGATVALWLDLGGGYHVGGDASGLSYFSPSRTPRPTRATPPSPRDSVSR